MLNIGTVSEPSSNGDRVGLDDSEQRPNGRLQEELSAACYSTFQRNGGVDVRHPLGWKSRDANAASHSAACGIISICSWNTTPDSGSKSPTQGARASTDLVWA